MRIYERDADGRIGSVSGSVSMSPPTSVLKRKLPYRLRWEDSFTASHRCMANPFAGFFHDPILDECSSRLNGWDPPDWLNEEEAALSVDFSGFKASFRTDVVRNLEYDEILGRYSLFEDRELLLRMMVTHMPVCAARARVFHYRSAERRTGGIEWGVITVLNRTYIVCKYSKPRSRNRRELKKYCYYKSARFLARSGTVEGRNRVIGTWRALKHITRFLGAPPEMLSQIYTDARERCLA